MKSLRHKKNYLIMPTTDKIIIDGVEYSIIYTDKCNPYERCDLLEKGQAVACYIYWFYRTDKGNCRACYQNDTSKNWEI